MNQVEFYQVSILKIYLRYFSALILNGLRYMKDFMIFTILAVLGEAQ